MPNDDPEQLAEHDPRDAAASQAKAREDRQARERANDAWQMRGSQGRAFVARLLRDFGIHDDVLPDSPAAQNRRLGRRSVALDLRRRLKAEHPIEWAELERENQ